jgi:RimJ/RimL family protein N-acetyltransferase
MRLRNVERGDLDLYVALYCDPEMWRHLGGPRPREGLEDKLERDVAATAADEYWVLVAVPDEGSETPAGTVAVWEHESDGRSVQEVGWMVRPEFQGRGIGKAAVAAAIERARATGRWRVLEAFPNVTNDPSNALCRGLGFTLVGEVEHDGPNGVLRCNHWRLDLGSTPG